MILQANGKSVLDDFNKAQDKKNDEPGKLETWGTVDVHARSADKRSRGKARKTVLATLFRVIISLIVIVIGVYLVLYVVSVAARFESISAMLQSMRIELDLMWQRIVS